MIPLTPSILQFETLGKQRGDRLLFADLSFTLAPGELLWIHGENGSGKTTILRLAAGLSQPSSGAVLWRTGGQDADPRHITAYQGHKDAHKDALTAREELRFWAEIYGYQGDIGELAGKMGLDEFMDVKNGALSAGQRRRLALSRLLMSGRPIWIMDEPTAAMDRDGYELVNTIMSMHLASGGSILAASHNPVRNVGGQARRIHLGPVRAEMPRTEAGL